MRLAQCSYPGCITYEYNPWLKPIDFTSTSGQKSQIKGSERPNDPDRLARLLLPGQGRYRLATNSTNPQSCGSNVGSDSQTIMAASPERWQQCSSDPPCNAVPSQPQWR
jgi:hypothetical protein